MNESTTVPAWHVAQWLTKSLIHNYLVRILIIMLMDVLATAGVVGSVAGLYALYQLQPGETLTLGSTLPIELSSDWKPYFIAFLGLLGAGCGLILYLSHRLSVAVAAAHFLQLNRAVLDTLGSQDCQGWQALMLPDISKNLRKLTGPGLRAATRASLILIDSIKPMLLLLAAAAALFYTFALLTLMLVPMVAAYLFYLNSQDRRLAEDQGNLDRSRDAFRSNYKNMLAGMADGQRLEKTTDIPDRSYLEMGEFFLQRKSRVQKLKSVNNAVLFLSLLLMFGYLAVMNPSGNLTQILVYFVLLNVAFRAMESLVSSLFLIARLTPDLQLVMHLLEFSAGHPTRPVRLDEAAIQPNDRTLLKLTGFDYFEQKIKPLDLSNERLVLVWQDEPVNRFNLPGVCLLLEQWAGLASSGIMKHASFVYSEADLGATKKGRGSLFVADGSAWDYARHLDRPSIYLVTNDIQRILSEADMSKEKEEPVCLLIVAGELLGYGTPSSLREYEHAILKKARKARRASSKEADDEA